MKSCNLAQSLDYDEVTTKHKAIPITRGEVDLQPPEGPSGWARGAVYAILGELLLAVVGVLMWKLFR